MNFGDSLKSNPPERSKRRASRSRDVRKAKSKSRSASAKEKSFSGLKAGRQNRQKRGKGSRNISRRRHQIRLFAMVTATCVGAALVYAILMSTTLESMVSLLLFRTSQPYMSRDEAKQVDKRFWNMIKRELYGGK